jgi:hypothetical protein
VAEKLGTEVKRMNTGIIAFDHNKIPRAQEDVAFLDDLLFLHPSRHAKALWRWTDDGAPLKQNCPIRVADVIRIDGGSNRLKVSFEKSPQHPPSFDPAAYRKRSTWPANSEFLRFQSQSAH